MRIDPIVDCSGDKIRTKQSFKKECDINHIMNRFRKTGILTPDILTRRTAQFADVSEVGDFQHCQEKIVNAQRAFDELPALIRSRFDNEPGKLLDFCANPENRAEAIDLGIIPKPEPAPEPETPPETPPAAPEPT